MNTPNNAMFINQPEAETVDGQAFYSVPSQPQRLREIVVLSPTAYAARLTAARHAEICRMVEQQLAEESAAAAEAQTGRATKYDDELAFLDAELDALRGGEVEPIVRLSKAQQDAIEADRPGLEEFENRWIL